MSKRRKNEFYPEEVSLMLSLVAGLDPDKYKEPERKAIIYKTKAACENGYTNVVNSRF